MVSPPDYRTVLEQSPFSTIIFDLDGRPFFVNSAFCALWDVGPEALDVFLAQYNVLEDQLLRDLGLMPYIQRAFAGQASAVPDALYEPEKTAVGEGLGMRSRWVRGHAYPVRGPEGRVRHVVVMHEDVTTQVEDRARLHTREQAFRALAENAPDIVARIDRDFRHLYVNPAIEAATGRPPEDYVGQDHAALGLEPERVASWRAVFSAVFATGTEGRQAFSLAGPDGEVRHYAARVVPEFDADGRVVTVLSVARDVTELRQAEQRIHALNATLAERVSDLEALNDELEAFAYSVAHDLKAPLRSIEGFASALEEDFGAALPADGQAYLSRVRSNAERMYRLIDDLMTLATVTGGEPRRATVDLAAQAAGVVTDLERAEEAARSRPVVIIARDLEAEADPALTRVVLWNLLDNAWKFTRDTAAPRIQVGVTERDGERVFFVRDNGVGFEPRQAEHLFGVFRRGDRRAKVESAGIGLATVRRIVHRHGGRVWGEGSPNGGATFYFHFGRG